MHTNKITVCLRCMLSLLLCALFLFSSGVAQGLSNQTADLLWQSKISADLWQLMETSSDTDIITVWLWKDKNPISQAIDTALRNEKGFDPDVYENDLRFEAEVVPNLLSKLQGGIMLTDTNNILSRDSDAVKNAVYEAKEAYSTAKTEILRREYTKANTEFVQKYVDTDKREVLYFSNYTSTLIVEATKAEIKEYAKTCEVTEISLFVRELQEPEEDVAFEQIHADSELGTKSIEYNLGAGYKGNGVTIGIIEAGGYYNTNHPQLRDIHGTTEDAQLRVLNNASADGTPLSVGVSGHATKVAALLIGQEVTANGKTYNEGLVPMAKAIVTPIIYADHVVNAIGRLKDAGCDVINYSGGSANGSAYSEYDKEVDREIINCNVVFVKSAGNIKHDDDTNEVITNSISISSPGKAVNAITVGNAYTKSGFSTALTAPYKMGKSSSYSQASCLPNKPDISAPGCNLCYTTVAGENTPITGTSLAAPMVTGVIAQMMEANPSLKNDNAANKKIKSMLIASADYHKINPDRNNSAYYYIDDTPVENFLREVSGAGLVNAVKAVNIARGINSYSQAYDLLLQSTVNKVSLGTLSPGEKVRIVMNFEKVYIQNEPYISPSHPLDDLNISLWNSNSEVAQSNSVFQNVEIIEYVVPANGGGVYHCDIDAYNMFSETVPNSVTWFKWRPADLNNDNIVSLTDYLILSGCINNTTVMIPEKEYIADVNKDGVIDSNDLALISAYIAGEPVVLQ